MCELSARIAAWRDTLAGRLSGAELDELEDHLRETLAGLSETPLSVDEQLLIAGRRLGAPGTLVAEFEKADPARVWQGRVFWMLAGWVGLGLVGGLAGCLFEGAALVAWKLGLPDSLTTAGAVVGHLVVWLGAAWLLAILARGHDRAVRFVGERLAGLPAVGWWIVVATTALVLLGLPGNILLIVRARVMPLNQFAHSMYAMNVVHMVLHVVVIVGLFAATVRLAGRQHRRAAVAANPGGAR